MLKLTHACAYAHALCRHALTQNDGRRVLWVVCQRLIVVKCFLETLGGGNYTTA